jgi:hypothetical protein
MSRKRITLNRKKGLYLKHAGHKGRGVFCTSRIKKGEVLEVTPALILNKKETERVDKTLLINYTFTTGKISKRLHKIAGLKSHADASSVIMGITSFCNHSEQPNAEVLWEEMGSTLYFSLRAIRPIPKNTEICTTYGDGWFNDRR